MRWVEMVLDGSRTQVEAAEELGLSERQVRRLVKRARDGGALKILHGLRGKPSNRRLDEALKNRVLELWESKYRWARLNFSHFTEKLNEVEGVVIGRESVRRLLRGKGVADRAVKKARAHRSRRERKPQVGELLQVDTSPHDWLGIGRKLHLVVVVDDATSKLLYARLFEHDGTVPNMLAMQAVFLKHGLPMAMYADRASWFFYTTKHKTAMGPKPAVSEVNRAVKTQIDRALRELGVEWIPAYSPQAKGRVERANGTLQGRLIPELRLRNIQDLEAANKYIEEEFIEDYNRRFATEPASAVSAFVKIENAEQALSQTLCLKFQCKVAKDNTVSRAKYFRLQLKSTRERINWHRALVEVRIDLQGQVEILHLPSKQPIPFDIIELKPPREAKNPAELPEIQRMSA